jgi:hypothetical protein
VDVFDEHNNAAVKVTLQQQVLNLELTAVKVDDQLVIISSMHMQKKGVDNDGTEQEREKCKPKKKDKPTQTTMKK